MNGYTLNEGFELVLASDIVIEGKSSLFGFTCNYLKVGARYRSDTTFIAESFAIQMLFIGEAAYKCTASTTSSANQLSLYDRWAVEHTQKIAMINVFVKLTDRDLGI